MAQVADKDSKMANTCIFLLSDLGLFLWVLPRRRQDFEWLQADEVDKKKFASNCALISLIVFAINMDSNSW